MFESSIIIWPTKMPVLKKKLAYMGLVVRKPVFGVSDKAIFKNSLHSYRDKLENFNFICSKLRYGTFQKANNKGADQPAHPRSLISAFVVRNPEDRGPIMVLGRMFSLYGFDWIDLDILASILWLSLVFT